MLRFTKRADYGLMAMHYIASHGDEGAVSAKRIADDYHWHLEITPSPDRLSRIGGIHVNDLPPEEAVRRLRDAWNA